MMSSEESLGFFDVFGLLATFTCETELDGCVVLDLLAMFTCETELDGCAVLEDG